MRDTHNTILNNQKIITNNQKNIIENQIIITNNQQNIIDNQILLQKWLINITQNQKGTEIQDNQSFYNQNKLSNEIQEIKKIIQNK